MAKSLIFAFALLALAQATVSVEVSSIEQKKESASLSLNVQQKLAAPSIPALVSAPVVSSSVVSAPVVTSSVIKTYAIPQMQVVPLGSRIISGQLASSPIQLVPQSWASQGIIGAPLTQSWLPQASIQHSVLQSPQLVYDQGALLSAPQVIQPNLWTLLKKK